MVDRLLMVSCIGAIDVGEANALIHASKNGKVAVVDRLLGLVWVVHGVVLGYVRCVRCVRCALCALCAQVCVHA